MNFNENHKIRPTSGVERIEHLCSQCQSGYYHFDKATERIEQHNQMPHRCNKCGHLVYFTIPYPALYYKGRVFVDWETIRGLPSPKT